MTPYEIQMLAGVNKMCSQTPAPPPRHPPTHLHVTEYLPPSHHHLQPLHFSCLSFPFISLSVHRSGRRSFAFVTGERGGKVRPSPLLCLLLSFLSSVPPPYLCSSYSLPSSFFAFDIQQLVWSRVSEERRGRNSRTTVNF